MASAVQDFVDILNLETLELNLFRGRSPQSSWQRVFGGQVIGQALVAACRTVDDVTARPPHSLHAYFLLGGDPKVPIIYEVDRIRDGKSFTTRRVVAIQHGHAIFSMSASFQTIEEGLSHQFPMPDVPKPDSLPSDAEMRKNILPLMPEPVRRYYERERPIELRLVEYGRYLGEDIEGRPLQCLDPRHRKAARRAGDPSMRLGLCVRHDAARFRADPAQAHGVQRRHHGGEPRSCAVDFTGRSAPTSGCSTARTARISAARAAFRGASFSPPTARWSPRSRRKGCCGCGPGSRAKSGRTRRGAVRRCVGLNHQVA